MKRNLMKIVSLILPVTMLSGCHLKQKVKEIAPYLFEVETYTELDEKFADKYYKKNNDNWGGGCSAITKVNSEGKRLIGRNMDLNISENCAYVVKTQVPGKYKTIGLQYTFRDVSPKYKEVKSKGIKKQWSKLLPFFQDDVMNEEGFYVELNMRHGEYYPNGDDMFAIKGTNPSSSKRIHMFELPIYFATNCKTIEEAKEYLKTLNVYSKEHYWNYCFLMADATGKAALLEFTAQADSENGIVWFDEEDVNGVKGTLDYLNQGDADDPFNLNYHALAQTNFFIEKNSFMLQDTKSGLGRMKAMQNGIDAVETRKDMYDLMNKVAYSNFYRPYAECMENNFDPRSEQLGEFPGATIDFLFSEELNEAIIHLMNEYTKPIRELSRAQKRADNVYWESTFTEVVDISEKAIYVRFFEDYSGDEKSNMKYRLSFDGFEKIDAIE